MEQINNKEKKLLFIVGSFSAGGAERSLVNQLCFLDFHGVGIYLYVFNNAGLFKSQIPSSAVFLETDDATKALAHSVFDFSFFIGHPFLWIKKVLRTSISKLQCRDCDINQLIWDKWEKDINRVDGYYDTVIGSQEGMTNYFAIKKVNAGKRVLWIHSEYEKLGYSSGLDLAYFSSADAVVTISDICRDSLKRSFPGLDNYYVLHNITSPENIRKMAMDDIENGLLLNDGCNIVSVGRLCFPKNFELAIETAALLKKNHFDFRWIIIGEGSDRGKLQNMIDSFGLTDDVLLLGLRPNPYKYIAKADIAVQCSLYEGKSIFAEEAKILGKVFVTTRYDTVSDNIEDGNTGIVVDLSPDGLAEGIVRSYSDVELKNKIVSNLNSFEPDITGEINKYLKLYLS